MIRIRFINRGDLDQPRDVVDANLPERCKRGQRRAHCIGVSRILNLLDATAQDIGENLTPDGRGRPAADEIELLKRALDEIRSESPGEGASAGPGVGKWLRRPLVPACVSSLFGTGVGLSAGLIRQLIDSQGFHAETMAAMGVIIGASAYLAFSSTGRLRPLVFQLSSFGLWTGFAIGFGVSFPTLAGDAGGVNLVAAAVSALLGAFIVEYRNRKAPAAPTSTSRRTGTRRPTSRRSGPGRGWIARGRRPTTRS